MESLLDPNEKREALRIGQQKAKRRRIPHPSNKGRPTKTSGVYYTEHVLVDPETYDFLVRMKNDRHEPIGAVINRFILKQKKVKGSLNRPDGQPVSQQAYIENMIRTHKTFEDTIEAMKNDGVILT